MQSGLWTMGAIVAIGSIIPLSCTGGAFTSGTLPTSSGGAGTDGSATAGFPSAGGTSGEAGDNEGELAAGTNGTSPAGGTTGTAGQSADSSQGGEGGSPSCRSAKSPSEEVCLVSDDAAVFVSPVGSDKNKGTTASPLKTISRALRVAHESGKLVLACSTAGAFREEVTVSASLDGARLYGGFDCDTWQYDASKKTEVTSAHTTALRLDGLTVGTTIEDIAFVAADGATEGENSLGAFITAAENVHLTRVSVTAGHGMAGMNGDGTSAPAATGAAGHNGHDACSATTRPNEGGMAVETECNGTPSGSIGGKGGDGGNDASSAGNANNGMPPLGDGDAGLGESNAGWTCDEGNGEPGHPGTSPSSAHGATILGTLTIAGWTGSSGGSGEDGTPGQGGGGAGGAKGPKTCGELPPSGASGGSGSGGGCGGKGGTGGQAGGSSIALAVLDSIVMLRDVKLLATDAGKGGDGGVGQPGGSGGDPGSGGVSIDVNDACNGGHGGKGGNGGSGGGAAGGISVGVLWSGSSAPSQTNLSITTGTRGARGIGGDAGQNDGITGVSQDELEAT
jgi:hypothetical protein